MNPKPRLVVSQLYTSAQWTKIVYYKHHLFRIFGAKIQITALLMPISYYIFESSRLNNVLEILYFGAKIQMRQFCRYFSNTVSSFLRRSVSEPLNKKDDLN